jgi:hypothetical protein
MAKCKNKWIKGRQFISLVSAGLLLIHIVWHELKLIQSIILIKKLLKVPFPPMYVHEFWISLYISV